MTTCTLHRTISSTLLAALVLLLGICAATAPGEAAMRSDPKYRLAPKVMLLLNEEATPPVTPPPAAPHMEILVKPDTVRVAENGTAIIQFALSKPPDAPLTVTVARVSGDT